MFEDIKNTSKTSITTLNCKGRLLNADKPKIMAILNVTPDSFYDGKKDFKSEDLVEKGIQLLDDGADILDIGGQSSRPGSQRISPQEELDRILPVLEGVVKKRPDALISIDTFYAEVAKKAVQSGAAIINDISAGELDPSMIETVGKLKVPYVIMHMQGNPQTMQENPIYENIVRELFDYFIKKIAECRKAGISDLILDPGFGFGKNIQHNFQLLHHLSLFHWIDLPIMIGVSRKSTIYKVLGTGPDKALNGTTVLHTIALMNGAKLLRVHDVKEALECIKLVQAYKKEAIP